MSINIELETEKYSEDPNAFIALIDSVINKSILSISDSELRQKQAQLIEVARSIDQLTKLSIPIPVELRNLKLSLLTEIDNMSQGREKLGRIVARLGDIVTRFESSYSTDHSKKGRRKSAPPRTKIKVFKVEIIYALSVLGGKAKAIEVNDIIKERMKDRFLPGDFDLRANGVPVWKNLVGWARLGLKKEGILRSDSARGVWELSEGHK